MGRHTPYGLPKKAQSVSGAAGSQRHDGDPARSKKWTGNVRSAWGCWALLGDPKLAFPPSPVLHPKGCERRGWTRAVVLPGYATRNR